MKCPYCGELKDRVVDSRESKEGMVIRRRRQCLACLKRFTSYEKIEEIPLMVIKKDGRREAFNPQKILQGMLKACEKRPVKTTELQKTVDEIENLLYQTPEKEISTKQIGSQIMDSLKELDKVAYVRFASVYREFKDLNEYLQELKALLNARE
jgi:transcriptional repressor NrdR